MTIQNSGAVSSDDVRRQLYAPSGGTVATNNANVQRLAKKQTGIRFPDDFRGKGWATQMNALSSSNNVGDSTNMRPYLMDRRVDQGKNPTSSYHTLDSSKSWYGGCYMYNAQNSSQGTTPVEYAWNGYFYMHNPYYQGPQFNLNGRINYEHHWVYGPQSGRTSINLIGFSAGYLSGNRKTLGSAKRDPTASVHTSSFSPFGYYDSSYRHVTVNLSQWQGGHGTSYVRFWDGWVA